LEIASLSHSSLKNKNHFFSRSRMDNSDPNYPDLPPLPTAPTIVIEEISKRKRFWRKFGGDGFLVSLGVHATLIIIALTWIVSRMNPPEPPPTTVSPGAGGGTGGNKISMSQHRVQPRNAKAMVKSPTRLVAKGTSSGLSLPPLPEFNASALTSGNLLGANSKGLGGGAGGGDGPGFGPGRGGGIHKVSMFGAQRKGINMLEGTLYDLKRDKNGRNLYDFGNQGARISEMQKAYLGFIRAGMHKSYFDGKYATAPDKLYVSNLFIPPVNANEATKAFNCADKIQAPGWLGYYEAWISPPETGSYRFAGMGDDGLLVAVQGDVKLWAPWTQGGMQTWVKSKGKNEWGPAVAYKADGGLPALGAGGRYFGSWFELRKGQAYRIQIVIAEGYGGLFSAELMLQQKGKKGDPEPAITEPLPVFKLAPLTPEELALRKGSRMAWSPEGPNFGCEINKVAVPRSVSTFR
jgi:hypothetical protein